MTEVHELLYDTGLSGKDTEPTSKCPGVPLEGKLHKWSEVQGKVESFLRIEKSEKKNQNLSLTMRE